MSRLSISSSPSTTNLLISVRFFSEGKTWRNVSQKALGLPQFSLSLFLKQFFLAFLFIAMTLFQRDFYSFQSKDSCDFFSLLYTWSRVFMSLRTIVSSQGCACLRICFFFGRKSWSIKDFISNSQGEHMLSTSVKELIMLHGTRFRSAIKLFTFFSFPGARCYDLMFVCMHHWAMNDTVDGIMVVKSDFDCICLPKQPLRWLTHQ